MRKLLSSHLLLRTQQLFLQTNPELSADEIRRQSVLSLFAVVGLSLTLLLGLNALWNNDFRLALMLFLVSSMFGITQRAQNNNAAMQWPENVLLFSLMTLMLYLIHTGGAQNTGPLWVYVLPPVALVFKGLRAGMVSLGVFVLAMTLLLFTGEGQLLQAEYSMVFKTRLMLSFITLICLCAYYEYSRQQSMLSLKRLSRQFELQAKQDPLTLLPNRRGMWEIMYSEYQRHLRYQRPMSLILIDVDHFKKVNDNYGHDSGDMLLQQLAELFRVTLRLHDSVARWGGEEFLIFLPETPAHEAERLAERLRLVIQEQRFKTTESTIRVTISGGVCEVSDVLDLEKAISRADKYLYAAKELGRNTIMPVQLDLSDINDEFTSPPETEQAELEEPVTMA